MRPAVLVVLDDDLAAARFLRLAREEMGRANVAVPLWVSDRSLVAKVGALGPAWRTAGEWQPACILPVNSTPDM